MAQKTRESNLINAPIKGEEKPSKFGWCLTGHHEGCIVRFPGYRCSCECHLDRRTNGNTESEASE